jgi:vacuolar protein sorting-associated protein 45
LFKKSQSVKQLVANSSVRDEDALRLVMLYALKYEKHSNNALVNLMDALKKRGIDEQKCKVNPHYWITSV